MTTDQFIVAQKHRKYWDQYVASLTMRLPPEAVAELQAILTAHGRPPTNWWCADCAKSALQYIYLQAALFLGKTPFEAFNFLWRVIFHYKPPWLRFHRW